MRLGLEGIVPWVAFKLSWITRPSACIGLNKAKWLFGTLIFIYIPACNSKSMTGLFLR